MSPIPTSVTEAQFEQYIRPYLQTAQRGYECKIALYKVFNYILKRLHTSCQWSELPIAADPDHPEKKEISWQAIYYRWQKWNASACFEQIWYHSLTCIQAELART